MSIVSIETAIHHLRADAEDSIDIQHKLNGAQEMAEQYMCRRIYATDVELDAAIDANAIEMNALDSLRIGALSGDVNSYAVKTKLERIESQMYEKLMIARGIVTNPGIEVAILLILGTLYEHREDVVIGTSIVRLPQAAEHRLQPYRRIMGL